MKTYRVQYRETRDGEEFSVKDSNGNVVIHPGSGPSDFICALVEELLLPEKEEVKLICSRNMPDYHARIIELFETLYNAIPQDKKPIER